MINISDWINIGAIITISGSAIYYFGRLLIDNKPQQENKLDVYVRGFIFIVGYILFPFSLVYTKWWIFKYVYSFFHNILTNPLWVGVYIISLLFILSLVVFFTAREYERRINISKNINFNEPENVQNVRGGEDKRKVKIMGTLWLVNLLYLSPIAIEINQNPLNILLLIVSFSLMILYTSILAILRGTLEAYYFPITVVLNDGTEIRGLLMEFRDPIIVWVIEDTKEGYERRKKYSIMRSAVKYTINENVVYSYLPFKEILKKAYDEIVNKNDKSEVDKDA